MQNPKGNFFLNRNLNFLSKKCFTKGIGLLQFQKINFSVKKAYTSSGNENNNFQIRLAFVYCLINQTTLFHKTILRYLFYLKCFYKEFKNRYSTFIRHWNKGML